MKVGLAQIDCKLGDVKANLEKIRGFISEAKKRKVDLLVFPELSLTGYSVGSLVPEVAIRVDNPLIKELKKESKGISLVIGFVEESKEHNFYNSALYLEKGRIKHLHRKIYLPNYGVWKKRCVSFNSKNKESGGDPLTKTVNCARSLTKGAWGLRNMPMLTRTRSGSGLLNIPAIDKYRR